ncbi:MAG: phosphoribosylaminoimidazolesuccinocarboxamide synthase [Gammaproteobacteria bacterium]|nr:phosphoribosylaminoimidazolesuccinocarboxamide synthase [Gammaproteobacteria bacterium]
MDTSARAPLFESNIRSLPLLGRGKVRDIYAVGEENLLIVTTDRLSAFDVVLPDPIPGKGEMLTTLSSFWFRHFEDTVPHHLARLTLAEVLPDPGERAAVEGRAVVVKRLRPLLVEAVVRGYLIGSGWRDYQKSGELCGISLPAGLRLADPLPTPIFTPSTKAASGAHDENIDFAQTQTLIGHDYAHKVREVALRLYAGAAAFARARGIIIADTKFEFGIDRNGEVVLIDEALTPDSSRFWPLEDYQPGTSPPSFDKQFVRDYLETLNWDKRAPGPRLPAEIITKTAAKYREALTRLTA